MARSSSPEALATLIGDGLPVPCADGVERPYADLDTAASTGPLPAAYRAPVEIAAP